MALTQVQSQMLGGNNPAVPTSVGVGTQALNSNSATNNTAVGYQAAYATNAGNNTALGYQALYTNTTGDTNVAVGYRANYSNTTGTNNVGVGKDAIYSVTTGVNNTGIGDGAGRGCTGNVSTFVGANAGIVATGSSNTFIGCSAGEAVTTGSAITILGRYNGNQNTLDMRTSSNVIVLSDGGGVPRAWYQTANFIIAPVSPTGIQYTADNAQFYPYPDNTAKLGYPSFRWTVVYAVSGTINTSDANQKQQIRSLDAKEKAVATRIKGLIKAFKWNDSVAKKGDDARIHVGVIAQDVQSAFIAEGLDPSRYGMFCSDTWYEVDGKAGKASDPYAADTEGAVEVTQLGIRYDQLLSFVISAL
jgi:hypothetical protein